MSRTVKFGIRGGHELAQKMQAVAFDVRFKGGRSSLRKAALVLAGIVRENSRAVDDPTTPRSIPANVAVRWNRRRYEASGQLGYRVGILGGAGGNLPGSALAGNPGGDTRYWRQWEFGNSRRPAQPFMRRALADNINRLVSVFADEYGRALTKAIKKADRKGG